MNKCKELDVKSWRDFVEYGKVDKTVKKNIVDSWVRCKKYNVNYMDGSGLVKYKIPVEIKLKENIELVSAAQSIIDSIYKTISGSGFTY